MTGPVFISFEGGEGSGKSTQANILRESMVAAGLQTVLVHEPGSTSLGEHLRRYLKEERRSLTREAELLLFSAARVQLVAEVVLPSLKRNINVVADRYVDSTTAYQGYGRGLDLEMVHHLNAFATHELAPNLTFLLDIEPALGLARVGPPQLQMSFEPAQEKDLGRQEEEGQRGFENQPLEFHRRVRRGYLDLARNNPERWFVLDGSLPKKELADQVWQEVRSRLSLAGVA